MNLFSNKEDLLKLVNNPKVSSIIPMILNENRIEYVLQYLSYICPIKIYFKEPIKLIGSNCKKGKRVYVIYDFNYLEDGLLYDEQNIGKGLYFSYKHSGKLYPFFDYLLNKIEKFEGCYDRGVNCGLL